MSTKARKCFLWLSLSKSTEHFVAECSRCKMFQKNNHEETMIPHEIPDQPWEKYAKTNHIFILF